MIDGLGYWGHINSLHYADVLKLMSTGKEKFWPNLTDNVVQLHVKRR